MRHRLPSILLVVVALVLVWSWAKPVQVQERRAERWEYCSVGIPYHDTAARAFFVDVRYLTPAAEGARFERVEVGNDAEKTVARTVAALGVDGWELVSVLDRLGDLRYTYHFKRRLN